MPLPPIAPLDDALEAHLAARRDDQPRAPHGAGPDPQRVRAPGARGRHGHRRGLDRRRAAPPRRRRRRGRADAAPPDRHRPDPSDPGRADRARLLPLRRPAGRPAGPVGDRAVRAVHAGRPDGRPGHLRRQGPDRDAPRRDRGAAGGPRRPAGEPHVRLRGRGGVRLREPLRVARDGARPPRCRRRGHQRHRRSSRATCRC